MVPSYKTKMELENGVNGTVTEESVLSTKRERNFPSLDLSSTTMLNTNNQPILVIQSPKTPTLSRKLKAVSLDSDPPNIQNNLEIARDVASMPNTPKKQIKQRNSLNFEDNQKPALGAVLGSNLKRFASNSSISGSQTLKTLPEVMTLQDFSDNKPEPIRIKAKGLLERRGSNASLTIDLGSNSNILEAKNSVTTRLNTTKSASHLNLSSFSTDKCPCDGPGPVPKKNINRSPNLVQEGSTLASSCKNRCYTFHKKCNCLCNFKCRRKSLSNENLYVPPCSFCQSRLPKDCNRASRSCKGCRRAVYPRQPDLEPTQLLSEDFKLHLQNIQYLQTAGSVLSITDLRNSCEPLRVPKLHQEFWEVPLNLQEKCLVSGSQSKNRYKGVLPNEHSRVHLLGMQRYIHANYIKGPDYSETAYIATQGPMEHTCEDFWEMVWSSKCKCIVMLTGLIEKGKNKCELYFPLGKTSSNSKSFFYVTTLKLQDKFTFDLKNSQKFEEETVAFEELNELVFGVYRIVFSKKESLGECVIRELELQKVGYESRKIYHYWFSNWQDHKMANPEQVLQIALHILQRINDFSAKKSLDNNASEDQKFKLNEISIINNERKIERNCKINRHIAEMHRKFESKNIEKAPKSPKRTKEADILNLPIVVHCSAGIGRTGCFLAILNGIQQLRCNFNVDVLAILCSLRLNRGGMVQTAEQYELIHRVLSLYTNLM